jgi:hypothetical protein
VEITELERLTEKIKEVERKNPVRILKGDEVEESYFQKCYYMDGIKCPFSANDPSLCAKCPYGYAYCFNQILKKVYDKIIAMFNFFGGKDLINKI